MRRRQDWDPCRMVFRWVQEGHTPMAMAMATLRFHRARRAGQEPGEATNDCSHTARGEQCSQRQKVVGVSLGRVGRCEEQCGGERRQQDQAGEDIQTEPPEPSHGPGDGMSLGHPTLPAGIGPTSE